MSIQTDGLRTHAYSHLITPAQLAEEIPLTDSATQTVLDNRQAIEGILAGKDARKIVIVGPCSIHDPAAAMDYAERLAEQQQLFNDRLLIVMRTYFEKPRTIVGWKGLINDPNLDETFDVNKGLRLARKLLADINELGLPTATEFLDTVTGQYIADLVSYGAIGARTTESQVHREMASALSCPVGFKNATNGSIQVAIDAMRASGHAHIFCSPDKHGQMTIYRTDGNPHAHIILRGGHQPNYHRENVEEVAAKLKEHEIIQRIIIDCSHGNSQKNHKNQLTVAADICQQLQQKSTTIAGIMIESFINEGKQTQKAGQDLTYGTSITDACLNWQDTKQVLQQLYDACEN